MPGKTVWSLSIEQEEVLSKMMKCTQNISYSFGMQMPGRSFSSGSYRYGFNGKESDDEISGTGNQYDYGFRIYNPRIGKFLSVDPLAWSYPMLTPYQFSSNNPILFVDLDGLEAELNPSTKKTIESISKSHPNRSIYLKTSTRNNEVYSSDIILLGEGRTELIYRPELRKLNEGSINNSSVLITFHYWGKSGRATISTKVIPKGMDLGFLMLEKESKRTNIAEIPVERADITSIITSIVIPVFGEETMPIPVLNQPGQQANNVDLSFVSKSAGLRNRHNAIVSLSGVADAINRSTGNIKLTGGALKPQNGNYDDTVPGRNYSYNQLAMMRAQTVMNLLIEDLGIPADRISITADNTGGMNVNIELTNDN
jgi:RHS repeat-associated protein